MTLRVRMLTAVVFASGLLAVSAAWSPPALAAAKLAELQSVCAANNKCSDSKQAVGDHLLCVKDGGCVHCVADPMRCYASTHTGFPVLYFGKLANILKKRAPVVALSGGGSSSASVSRAGGGPPASTPPVGGPASVGGSIGGLHHSAN